MAQKNNDRKLRPIPMYTAGGYANAAGGIGNGKLYAAEQGMDAINEQIIVKAEQSRKFLDTIDQMIYLGTCFFEDLDEMLAANSQVSPALERYITSVLTSHITRDHIDFEEYRQEFIHTTLSQQENVFTDAEFQLDEHTISHRMSELEQIAGTNYSRLKLYPIDFDWSHGDVPFVAIRAHDPRAITYSSSLEPYLIEAGMPHGVRDYMRQLSKKLGEHIDEEVAKRRTIYEEHNESDKPTVDINELIEENEDFFIVKYSPRKLWMHDSKLRYKDPHPQQMKNMWLRALVDMFDTAAGSLESTIIEYGQLHDAFLDLASAYGETKSHLAKQNVQNPYAMVPLPDDIRIAYNISKQIAGGVQQ